MPSAFTHAFLGVAGAKTFVPGKKGVLFGVLCVFCSILPDVDVLTLYWKIPYTAILGHRGFTHSFFFAFLLAAGIGYIAFPQERRFSKSWWGGVGFVFCLTSAHGILDAMTDGGQGVALLWPFDPTRFFLPWRPLRVSPLGLDGFFTPWGMEVLRSEILWVWLPAFWIWGVGRGLRRVRKLQRERGIRLAAS
jgi:inner membrane protein